MTLDVSDGPALARFDGCHWTRSSVYLKQPSFLLLDSLLQEVCIESGSHVSHNLLYSGLKKAHSKKKSFSNRTTYNLIYVVEIHHLTKHPPAGSIGSDSVRVMVTK